MISVKGHKLTLLQALCLMLYYTVAQWLPASNSPLLGGGSKRIRYFLCKHIFASCGINVNIERRANFGAGTKIKIGNGSGLGVKCVIPNGSTIGDNVIMGPNCFVIARNHEFSDTSIPIGHQGYRPNQVLTVEDDVWIGRDVLITPGRTIKTGSIIAAGCVLSKDFPKYSIVGGNPSRLLKTRK